MDATVTVGPVSFRVNLALPVADCTISVLPRTVEGDAQGTNVMAWSVAEPVQQPLAFDKYLLDTRRGGSCNANTLFFSPHTAGTHTECVGTAWPAPLRMAW
jgi:hypothetical protein